MSKEYKDEEGEFLVKLARTSIETYLEKEKIIPPPENTPEKLKEKSGVFVTLQKISGETKNLRGCIGHPYPDSPLVSATIDSAISSATRDPRFPPVKMPEMDEISITVTILTPPKLIEVKTPKEYFEKVVIGRDGLIVERGNYARGLLLPQVPVDFDWDKEEFLANTCMKAGLPPDAWLVDGTKIYSFQSIIFEEETPKGKIERRELLKC
ncbi:MAG: TIGR00296 family protein [Candidatus Hodarchaeota archaeon]